VLGIAPRRVRAGFEQRADDVDVAAGRGEMERLARVGVGAALEQETDGPEPSTPADRRPAPARKVGPCCVLGAIAEKRNTDARKQPDSPPYWRS